MAGKQMAAEDAPERPRYRVTELSYIDDALQDVGQEVYFDGAPGSNLEPLNAPARAAKAAVPAGRIGPGHPDFVKSLIEQTKPGDAPKA